MAKKHISNLREIKDAGILLKTNEEHEIRILGASAIVTLEELPPAKEALVAVLDDPNIAAYHQGTVKGEQEDPTENELNPQVPSFAQSSDGELVFLIRELD